MEGRIYTQAGTVSTMSDEERQKLLKEIEMFQMIKKKREAMEKENEMLSRRCEELTMSIKCQKHQRQELMKERIELGPENGKLAKDAKIRLKAYIKLIEREEFDPSIPGPSSQ
ncbi:Coiled-coil domain-containing protein 152 [Caenorhabditis elegans]|uniref:Coiled-coil domain-containing protein 152 n=1 Tax=Caenorhabditis elegans TaxID=6239 RepID=A0A4V0IJ98_CAEEL|nr:Coiled-coil domain-containing protein 152 [Caenorhabditis elegans]VTW47563.1 Coiled-coil domain-containing protein 152 [Caenorhabditis elegans]